MRSPCLFGMMALWLLMNTSLPALPFHAGRAEPIRLALAAAGVDFDFEVVDKAAMKSDAEHYPFHQVPR